MGQILQTVNYFIRCIFGKFYEGNVLIHILIKALPCKGLLPYE